MNSIYITLKSNQSVHQMSFEEFLDMDYVDSPFINYKFSGTRTYKSSEKRFLSESRVNSILSTLHVFNEKYKHLYDADKESLYRFFQIPKKHGGLRKISEPNDELKAALYDLVYILNNEFTFGLRKRRGALYHTNAFAYIKNRCAIDAVKKHQMNKSNWFGKYDLHDFFGSTTIDFAINQLSMIYPFNEVIAADTNGEMRKALELGFLNGGLPQGTPLSPVLTNIMMIPIDFELTKLLRDYNGNMYIYTRYADDFIISSIYKFDEKEIAGVINKILSEFHAPFVLNETKTRFGSRSGRNWNLGVMLNKDNQITIGHKNKAMFKAMLSNYVLDRLSGTQWEIGDIQTLDGKRSYYTMVEKDAIESIIAKINEKYHCDVMTMIRSDLKAS